jgi:hypothetical protein
MPFGDSFTQIATVVPVVEAVATISEPVDDVGSVPGAETLSGGVDQTAYIDCALQSTKKRNEHIDFCIDQSPLGTFFSYIQKRICVQQRLQK